MNCAFAIQEKWDFSEPGPIIVEIFLRKKKLDVFAKIELGTALLQSEHI